MFLRWQHLLRPGPGQGLVARSVFQKWLDNFPTSPDFFLFVGSPRDA